MAAAENTFDSIRKDVDRGNFAPAYYLMGEESYFVDLLADYIVSHALTEEEKDFNLSVFYGGDTDIQTVITTARRYPLMSKYQVVLVREAQLLKQIDGFASYLTRPQPQTIVVFLHKNGVIDRRKKIGQLLDKHGVIFESKRYWDWQMPAFINSYVSAKNLSVDEKSVSNLVDFVGTDLSRMAGEIDKLAIILQSKKSSRITADIIEENIGLSKDFNSFEFRSALISKDIYKANLIAKYFDKNQKQNPIQATLSVLFNFFSNLLVYQYLPKKDDNSAMEALQLRRASQLKDYRIADQNFTYAKTTAIIHAIRTADARSKGVGNNLSTPGDILRDLTFVILH